MKSKPPLLAESPVRGHQIASEISRLALFQNFQRAFGEATGLPLRLVAPGVLHPDQSGGTRRNRFCELLSCDNQTCAACLLSQRKLISSSGGKPLTQHCFAGLNESSVAIRIGDKIIGYLLTGEVATRKPTSRQFTQIIRQLRNLGAVTDEAALRRAYLATRVMSQKQYRSILDLLSIFAGHLSLIAGQLEVHDRNADAPNISRARKFIEENLTEPLDLKTVAEQAHLSSCYFCKRFKESTGLTFTEYVARIRVEAAKNRLLSPQARISEVAFEVGFQSLTHFNRVFRQLTGQSPTKYRESLPSAELKHDGIPRTGRSVRN